MLKKHTEFDGQTKTSNGKNDQQNISPHISNFIIMK